MTISALAKRRADALEKLNEAYAKLAEEKQIEVEPIVLPAKHDEEVRSVLTLEILAERLKALLPAEEVTLTVVNQPEVVNEVSDETPVEPEAEVPSTSKRKR